MATKEKARETETTAALAIPIERIRPDPRNRKVEDDDELQSLTDSIAVLGLLQPVHVKHLPGSEYELVDGERRWRAAQKAGLDKMMAFVVAGEANESGALVGLALNEHRRAAGCLHVARRLREIKNALGLTHEELAARTGLSLDRIKTYASIFAGSDALLAFFDEKEVPLTVAAEFVRYEKATNEAKARKLIQRHLETPLSKQQIVALRKRATEDSDREPGSTKSSTKGSTNRTRSMFAGRIERAFASDPANARVELEQVLARLGFGLTQAETSPGDRSCPANFSARVGAEGE